ncbi:lysophospholipid acyltransferase family protein [Candidatus Halocynthiibacter alkanivorans]|uniref:lysophospholipid acyltransferase family protein n=1 Tax=Candidatus Halocynthiibacter alkanivorans TaxID=2267619 RepID=UPI000DF1F7D3|nr:lysophospholipid acyltransferase family protein [Candidatus Halocynthiibacter alkanivorans]
MGTAIQYLRSLVFNTMMYVMMVVFGLLYLLPSVVNRKYAYRAIRTYCRYVRWSASWMIGLKSEIRGPVPDGEVIIASKHQSFFDVLMLVSVLPRPKFIVKKELRFVPIVGFYSRRIGCIYVDRGKRSAAIKSMVKGVKESGGIPGQLIIFPQGTRVAAGKKMPYKIGAGVLFEKTGQAMIPASTNVGAFWPRHGLLRKPGLAVLEFLPEIAPGVPIKEAMKILEQRVEGSSDALLVEVGFTGKG